jgi:hypothetical protein
MLVEVVLLKFENRPRNGFAVVGMQRPREIWPAVLFAVAPSWSKRLPMMTVALAVILVGLLAGANTTSSYDASEARTADVLGRLQDAHGPQRESAVAALRKFCLAISALGESFPVRILKGKIGCSAARRTLRSFIVHSAAPRRWTCFRGHGQDVWSATCIKGSEQRARVIVRAYNPTS